MGTLHLFLIRTDGFPDITCLCLIKSGPQQTVTAKEYVFTYLKSLYPSSGVTEIQVHDNPWVDKLIIL